MNGIVCAIRKFANRIFTLLRCATSFLHFSAACKPNPSNLKRMEKDGPDACHLDLYNVKTIWCHANLAVRVSKNEALCISVQRPNDPIVGSSFVQRYHLRIAQLGMAQPDNQQVACSLWPFRSASLEEFLNKGLQFPTVSNCQKHTCFLLSMAGLSPAVRRTCHAMHCGLGLAKRRMRSWKLRKGPIFIWVGLLIFFQTVTHLQYHFWIEEDLGLSSTGGKTIIAEFRTQEMQSWLGARVRPFKLFLLPFLCTLRCYATIYTT